MRTYINRLRKKSRGEQSRAAFIAASLITAAIVVVWSFTLPARLASTVPETAAVVESQPVEDFVESTKSDLENIVRTAEVWKGAPPGGSGVNDSAPLASTTPEVPRKVLITTSSSTKTSEKSE